MLSRVANAVYWTARYVERAENVARFVEVNLNLMLDSGGNERPDWSPLVFTTGDQELFAKHYGEATPENVVQFLTFDTENPNSVFSSLRSARENAQTVRDVISREMWEELNGFYLFLKDARKNRIPVEEMGDFFAEVKKAGMYFEGVTNATLSRGEAWNFARLGRLLERADKTSRILDVKYFTLLPHAADVGNNVDQIGWRALLNSASALQMYRQSHHVTTPASVVDFLVLDANFPRSVRHCVRAAQESLHAITGTRIGAHHCDAERLLGKLRAILDYEDADFVMTRGMHEFLDDVQSQLNLVSSNINETFFSIR